MTKEELKSIISSKNVEGVTDKTLEYVIADIIDSVRISKMNGLSEEGFLKMLGWYAQKIYKEEALEMFRSTDIHVEIGTPCTINYYTDRRAATVVKMPTPRKAIVQFNKVKCLDFYNSDYEILDELEDDIEVFTLRKNGTWVEEGFPKRNGSVTCTMGYHYHYIDPSF